PAETTLADIDPASLKALYRYAAGDHNLGVSIGWTGTRVERDDNSPILLDREFVDTKVGQDLILADQIPWKLYEVQPEGWSGANPIADSFCKARKEWDDQSRKERNEAMAVLSGWAATRQDFSPEGRKRSLDRMSLQDRYDNAYLYVLLKSSTAGGAAA